MTLDEFDRSPESAPAGGAGTVLKRPQRQGGKSPMDQLLSVKEAADVLSCSEAAIRKWLYERRLPRVKLGRLTRIRQSDLEGLLTHGLR